MAPFSYANKVSYQAGAALLVTIVTLLAFALSILNLSAQQIMAQHEMVSLEFRRLERQRATEQLFESIVLMNHQSTEGIEWHQHLHGSSSLFNQLSAQRELVACPHSFETTSLCTKIRVQHANTGFIRERILVQPASHCSEAYWYAPAARVGQHVGVDPIPKDPPPFTRPGRPPPRLDPPPP